MYPNHSRGHEEGTAEQPYEPSGLREKSPIDISTPTQRHEKRMDGEHYQRTSEEGNVEEASTEIIYTTFLLQNGHTHTYGYTYIYNYKAT